VSKLENPAEAFERRGAPFTFDVDAFIKLVTMLRSSTVNVSEESSPPILIPSFDHSVQDPVENDMSIAATDRVIILEGNYLLLNESPWSEIAGLVDERCASPL